MELLGWISQDADELHLAAELFDRYGDELYRLAYAVVKDPYMAEDAIQGAFVHVIEHIDRFNVEEDHVIRRLKCYVRNEAIDLRRGVLVAEKYESSIEDADMNIRREIADDTFDPVLGAEWRDIWMRLREEYRQVLEMYAAGLSYDEMASLIGSSREAVKKKLQRAKIQLKKELTR